jgi:hypothetical protein
MALSVGTRFVVLSLGPARWCWPPLPVALGVGWRALRTVIAADKMLAVTSTTAPASRAYRHLALR